MNVKFTDTPLKNLKTVVKNKTGTTLRMSLKMFDGDNLPHELFLMTNRKIKQRNAFNNNISTDLKLSKAQIFKIIQSWGFLGSLLSKLAGPLMKVAAPVAENILAALGITAAASAVDAGIPKNAWFKDNSFNNFKPKINDIIEIVQALEDSDIMLKQITKTVKNKKKEQKGGFLNMLLGTLGVSFFGKHVSKKRNCKSWFWD